MATIGTGYSVTTTGGGFSLDGSVNRTLAYGSTSQTIAAQNAYLYVTGPGTATITITATACFTSVDFTGSSATITGTIAVRQNLTLSATGTYTGLNANNQGGGINTGLSPAVWTCNGKSLGAITAYAGTGSHYQYMNDDLRCTSFTLGGVWDFSNQPSGITGPFNLICSGAISISFYITSCSLVDAYGNLPASMSCTTFSTLSGNPFTLFNSNITASTSVTTSGAFVLGVGGTITTPNFIHQQGTVTLNTPLVLQNTSTYTFTTGTLTLNGNDLTTGIFSSSGAVARVIAYGGTVNSGSALLNGTNQYLSITTTPNGPLDLAAGAGNWTVECWFNLSSLTGTRTIFEKGGSTGSVNGSYSLSFISGTGQWVVGDGGAGGAVQNLATTFKTNTWYHFALVRNGSTLTAYVNGVADTPVTMSFTMGNTSNDLLGIGNAVDGGV